MSRDDLREGVRGVALVQENRLLHARRERELRLEARELILLFREVAIEIQPALTHGDHALVREQFTE